MNRLTIAIAVLLFALIALMVYVTLHSQEQVEQQVTDHFIGQTRDPYGQCFDVLDNGNGTRSQRPAPCKGETP